MKGNSYAKTIMKINSHVPFTANTHGLIKCGLTKSKVGEKPAEKTKTFMKPIDK